MKIIEFTAQNAKLSSFADIKRGIEAYKSRVSASKSDSASPFHLLTVNRYSVAENTPTGYVILRACNEITFTTSG